MINNFWFYFFLTPVVVGTIILSIPSFYYSSINPPVFEEAVSTCKDISNEDVYALNMEHFRISVLQIIWGNQEIGNIFL